MQLTVRLGDESADPEVVYEGSVMDELEVSLFDHVDVSGGRYARNVKRWWNDSAKENVEDGLEPLWAGFNGTQLTTWKVYQTPVGS